MKNLCMILFVALVFCFTFACQQTGEVAEEPVVNIEADVEAIKGVIKEISRVWKENDYEGWMALMDEEAVLLLNDGPTLEGLDTIKGVYSNPFNLYSFELAITTDEIHIWGDIAFSRDGWKGSINLEDGSEPIVFDYRMISIYKRQADGSWKIWRVIFNNNLPPAAE